MLMLTVDVPEPFGSALARGTPLDVCDHEAPTDEALFGRGLARREVGREADARQDFLKASATLRDACQVELALTDLREPSTAAAALHVVREIAERASGDPPLAARAWHVAGVALGKLRRTNQACDALLRAAQLYRETQNPLGRAHVFDSLGMLEASRGRLDLALGAYALSLVDKTLLGDEAGMAITLGNLGRVHLRAGRFADAVECFHRDREIAARRGDFRGQARMHNDLGLAYLGMGDFARSEQELSAGMALARRRDFADMEFFALKDRALLRMAQGRLDEADADLALAERALPQEAESFLQGTLEAARGELLLARQDARASIVLAGALKCLEQCQMPDQEIPCRIALAKALVAQRCKGQAEQVLLRGIKLARREGFSRYLAPLNEAMAALDLVEGALDEPRRHVGQGPDARPDGYHVRARLGGGAFGEVFRVYDPERNCELALKRLHLERLYDVERRRDLLNSAKTELEAASRVRHPGVARVHAIGTDADGVEYIVQEFVDGKSLRDKMPKDASVPFPNVLSCLLHVADSLHALHLAGVVHRDLKPDNILVRDNGLPVLVDFGVAHLAGSWLVNEHAIAGSLGYMAPEQALGKRVDARSDLYALGVIGFEWLTGILPVWPRGETFEELARDLARRKPRRIADFRSDIPADVDSLIMSLLSKKPHDRPSDARVLATAIRSLVQE